MGKIATLGIKAISREFLSCKISSNNTGVTAAGHKEIKVEARPSMIEKSTKYSRVAATRKDVTATGKDVATVGKDVAAAEKEGRKC